MNREREWKEFKIQLKIKDHDGQVKELKAKKSVELKGDNDKLHGEQYVKFAKDGKVYEVKVMINELKKGLFKDKLVSVGIDLPSGSDFIIEPSGSKNGKGWEIELADNPLKPGGIFLMVGITTVIIGGIIAFILWKKKKR